MLEPSEGGVVGSGMEAMCITEGVVGVAVGVEVAEESARSLLILLAVPLEMERDLLKDLPDFSEVGVVVTGVLLPEEGMRLVGNHFLIS